MNDAIFLANKTYFSHIITTSSLFKWIVFSNFMFCDKKKTTLKSFLFSEEKNKDLTPNTSLPTLIINDVLYLKLYYFTR